MSIFNCHKQEPQPWMSYISQNKITYSGDCCPVFVTDTEHLLPFQIISEGDFIRCEISEYGSDVWNEITLPITTVITDGFYIHSYNGEAIDALDCGPYEFRLIAGETWYFEPIMIEDFDITTNEFSKVDELMTPFKFTEQIIDTTPLIAPCDRILPFMFRTDNVTSGSVVVTMVDSDGAETALSITVQTGVIDGKTYYWHRGECLYPFLTCGKYYLKIVDGANTYYSVPFVPECGISDIPDGYQPMRDMNGCVMRDTDGAILYEECSDIPDPEPPIEEIKYGLLYNWYAAADLRNICSEGWHIPTFEDAMELGANTGAIWDGEEGSYPTGGEKFKEEFTYPDTCGEGYAWDCCMGATAHTNEFAFNARGCGQRQCDAPPYDFTSKRESSIYIIIDNFDIFCGHFAVYCGDDRFYVGGTEKFKGHSIRPVKDSTTLTHGQSGTYTDPSGYTYRTICIGAQEWVADSIRTMHYRNGDPIPEVTDRIEWVALITGALCAYDNDWNNV